MPIHLFTDYLSIIVGFQCYLYLNKRTSLSTRDRYVYVIGGLLGALVGSRVLAILNDVTILHAGFLALILGEKTIIGAIAGGILGIEIAKKIMGIRTRTGDGVVVPLMIAIIIGRIGCQLTGVSDGTIGIPCDLPWCFPQGDGFSRHPLPLYEIIALLAALPFAYRAYIRKMLPEGMLFRFFIIGYFGLRFFLEYLNDDPHIFFTMSAIQIVCLAVALLYLYDVARELSSLKRVIGREERTNGLHGRSGDI